VTTTQFRPLSRMMPVLYAAAMLLSFPAAAHAQVLAPTPPMGWNSWDAYGTTVRESEVRANADYMATKLRKFGWQYVVVDIEWYAIAPTGRIVTRMPGPSAPPVSTPPPTQDPPDDGYYG